MISTQPRLLQEPFRKWLKTPAPASCPYTREVLADVQAATETKPSRAISNQVGLSRHLQPGTLSFCLSDFTMGIIKKKTPDYVSMEVSTVLGTLVDMVSYLAYVGVH